MWCCCDKISLDNKFNFRGTTMQYATKRLIDSVWTMAYEMKDNQVVIHSYDRDNPIGYDKEKELPQFEMIEGDKRVVTGVIIAEEYQQFRRGIDDGVEYTVANPKYVFSYDIDVPPVITVKPEGYNKEHGYLEQVEISGTALSDTPEHQTLGVIKGKMLSALNDAVYLSLKVRNVMDTDQLIDISRATIDSINLDVTSETLSVDEVSHNQHEQRITIKITQDADADYPVLTNDVLEAAQQFQAEFPKVWQKFDAKDVSLTEQIAIEEPVVRTAANVKQELTETLDKKFDITVSPQPYDAFLVEIRDEHGLVERLPSFQPNFEERYARMLDIHAAPKVENEQEVQSPRMSR